MSLIPATLLFVLFLLVLTAVFAKGTRQWPELWKKLPRQRAVGVALAFLCLLWAANYTMPLLEGGAAGLKPVIKMLVPALTILAFFHLNFLFVRGMGGLIVLTMNHLLHLAFVAQFPGRPLFSLLCYLMVFAGLVCVVAPWRFRDLLEKTMVSAKWRHAASVTTALFAVLFLVLMTAGVAGT